MFMFLVFGSSCHKLVAKPQYVRIPSKGSVVVGER